MGRGHCNDVDHARIVFSGNRAISCIVPPSNDKITQCRRIHRCYSYGVLLLSSIAFMLQLMAAVSRKSRPHRGLVTGMISPN